MPRDGNTAILRYCDTAISSLQKYLCGYQRWPTVTVTATAMVHYYLLSSFVDLSSHYKVSPGQPGSAAQTCDILGSLQSPDRNSIAPADFSHRYRSLGSQDSGLRTQDSGLRRGVLGPPAHAQLP